MEMELSAVHFKLGGEPAVLVLGSRPRVEDGRRALGQKPRCKVRVAPKTLPSLSSHQFESAFLVHVRSLCIRLWSQTIRVIRCMC